MGFENSTKFGTPNLTEEQLYKMNREINKALWEKGETQTTVNQEAEPKKSGFGIK